MVNIRIIKNYLALIQAFWHAQSLIVNVVQGKHSICLLAVVLGATLLVGNLRPRQVILLGLIVYVVSERASVLKLHEV